VLYSKDMKTLLIYPLAKADKVFEIPEGVESVSDFLFVGCKNLREVKLPSTLTTLSMAMFNTTQIEKVNLNYVEKLGGGTFSGCNNIEVLVLPENVKELGDQEFYDCSVTALVIENPQLITANETFMQAETLSIFLTYDGLGDKERSWMPYVAGVYEQSEWEYVNGVPTLKSELAA